MTRQELYDEIKKSSKDEYILEQMQTLGFFTSEKPTLPAQELKRKVELKKEISSLRREIVDPQAALKAIHVKRKKQALLRREETKQKKILLKEERRKAYLQKRESELVYIGEHFSYGLTSQVLNVERLQEYKLPLIRNALQLAQLMQIPLSQLRFLLYFRKVSKLSHYKEFLLQKRRGGYRRISTPMPKLKQAQYWIMDTILNKLSVHSCAHGFIKDKNILSNASNHINKSVVINFDLKDFFPTISFVRIKGLFIHLGYSEEISTVLSLLTTQSHQEEIELDNEHFFVHSIERVLPQGAPTSPMLSNLICINLDKRLEGLAQKFGFVYSRYADDLSFSSDETKNIPAILKYVESIVSEEGFTLHEEKTSVMRAHQSQDVTGVVVNEKTSIRRKELKKFRALLYQIKKDGLEGKSFNGGVNILDSITGYAHFINMIDPVKGEKFLFEVEEIKKLYAPKQGIKSGSSGAQSMLEKMANTLDAIFSKEKK